MTVDEFVEKWKFRLATQTKELLNEFESDIDDVSLDAYMDGVQVGLMEGDER